MPASTEEKIFNLKPYREFVLTTTSYVPKSSEEKELLLSDKTNLSTFWDTVSPQEKVCLYLIISYIFHYFQFI